MTDFYAQLEAQLVGAGVRRQTQGTVARSVAGRGRAILATAAALAVLAAGGAFALPAALTSSSTNAPAAPPKAVTVPARPVPVNGRNLAGIGVAVFNATTSPGLARRVSDRLQQRGARIVATDTAPSRRGARTAVFYRAGSEAKARRVARALGAVVLGPFDRAKSPVIAPTSGLAAAVVVIAGPDALRLSPDPVAP